MLQQNTENFLILMIFSGLSIGGIFSMYPTIILAFFGKSNFGQVLSLIAIATSSSSIFIASLIGSHFYEENADENGFCYGTHCFYNAFLINALLCVFAFILSIFLSQRPKLAVTSIFKNNNLNL